MRAYIHIGLPKTGTTSFQNFLVDNRKSLSNDGVFIPETQDNRHRIFQIMGNAYSPEHKYFSRVEIDSEESKSKYIDKYFENLIDQSRQYNPHTIVFSEETISLLGDISLLSIRDYLGRYFSEINVVCCLRKHDEYLKSNYSQMIRARYMSDPYSVYVRGLEEIKPLNYCDIVKVLENIFSRERMHLVRYSNKKGGSNQMIMEICGIENREGMIERKHANVSPGDHELIMKREINKAVKRVFFSVYGMEYNRPAIPDRQIMGYIRTLYENSPDVTNMNKSLYDKPHAKYKRRWAEDWKQLLENHRFYPDCRTPLIRA